MKTHQVGLLAYKHWLNDLRSSETRLLVIATLLAALSMSMISSFSDRLSRTMHYRASELIAGDLTLHSTRAFAPEYAEQAKSFGLDVSQAMGFSTMAFANDQLQLIRVRSVQDNYPLKGYNQVANGFYADERTQVELISQAPEPGTVWAEERILQKLRVNIGDSIEIGDAVFTIDRILQQDADRSGSLFSPFGQLLMSYSDVPKTGVVNEGSRIFYKQYFTGDEAQLSQFVDWLKPQLSKADRLAGIEESQNNVGNALQKAQQYLSLASLISVLLAAVAIALCAKRYSERHYNTAALFRCLGASSAQVRNLFIYKLVFTALVGAVLGATLGFALHFILLETVADILPKDLMPARLLPVLISLVCAALVLILIALAPILNLNQVSPVRVLRRELAPQSIKANVFFVLAVVIMLALAYLLSGSIWLSVIFVVGLAVLLLVYGVLSTLLLNALVKVQKYLPNFMTVGLTQLSRHQYYARSQVAAFAFIFTSVALIWLVRGDLFDDWQQQVPADTPNHFAINIFPESKDDYAAALDDKGLAYSEFYPMVRGRLSHINGVNVSELFPDDTGPNAIRRELNLTWNSQLTQDETLVEGSWFNGQSVDQNGISLEAQLAKRLNVKLGDKVTFNIAGRDIVTTVENLREVKWENIRPNFYVVFADGVLNAFHHTYINSFYLPPNDSRWLIEMNQRFKAITIIEIDQILKQVREILAQTSVAVEAILALVLVCAMVLMFATLLSTLSLRKHEAALYRTFGASEGMIRSRIRSEYITLALVASILAIASFEAISLTLYVFIFDVSWRAHVSLWLGIPVLALTSILISGFWANRDVLKASPRQLLQDIA
ncbi:ABC transporter permease [Oceaniserpentilla sp. 4NH20-0058]|uniref:ABC transporter permease n=1 Tax=Oceaniserpentilla sp. 4NH20-0058 TaxID=3127660 RepID=UPI003105450A